MAGMKMYILIPDDITISHALVATAHASLAGYLRFNDRPDTQAWLDHSFRKVIGKVTRSQFDAAKEFEDHVALTESSLDGLEVALVFAPRPEWPKAFTYYPLYR